MIDKADVKQLQEYKKILKNIRDGECESIERTVSLSDYKVLKIEYKKLRRDK